jgi:uracil phosphoribosyltransferase
MKKYLSPVQKKYFFSISLSSLFALQCSAAPTSYQSHDFPIVKCSLQPNTYEQILMTTLRDENSSREQFRHAANKLIEILVSKVFDCLGTRSIEINTPVATCMGKKLEDTVDQIVSVMRSGDVPLNIFSSYFPSAAINKILIQRDEETAEPVFKYQKFSPTISQAKKVIITEPMIATGGTLCMVIELLKQQGVETKNIIIAAICAAPEGLNRLAEQYPDINVVLTVIDDHLNEKQYISPGIGDFGDRYFGT